MKLELLRGIKGLTTIVEWRTGYGEIIRRYNRKNVNASSAMQREVKWSVQSPTGEDVRIPEGVRRHEVSIAKWLAAKNQIDDWKTRTGFSETPEQTKADWKNFNDANNEK